MLPYGRQSIDEDDIAAVAAVLRSDLLTTGPMVTAFERALADRVGAAHAVACNSGTAALHLALLAHGVGKGDVCIVPAITFLATANAVRHTGAEVAFADVDPDSGLMTPATLSDALSRTDGHGIGAVLPVHLRGEVCDQAALTALAQGAGAPLIEDAAHALGSTGPGGPVGAGATACFSFHPVKTLCTGEGGMVTTQDFNIAERARRLRSHGMTPTPDAGPWAYEMEEVGFNYRLPDILCALGLSQLSKLDAFVARRRALVEAYRARLFDLAPLVLPAVSPAGSNAAPHLMTVLIDFQAARTDRAEVMARLRAEGIGSQVHYIPVHTQPYYRARYAEPELAGAERWYSRCLSLPLFPAMQDGDVDRVVDALSRALAA